MSDGVGARIATIADIDMHTCPNCGQDRLEPIATILDPSANQPDAEKHTKPAETA